MEPKITLAWRTEEQVRCDGRGGHFFESSDDVPLLWTSSLRLDLGNPEVWWKALDEKSDNGKLDTSYPEADEG